MTEDLFHYGVKVLLQNEQGHFLLLKKETAQSYYWDIPGGRINRGETIDQALHRELKEEIGSYDLASPNWLITFPTSARIQLPHLNVGLILSIYHSQISSTFRPILSHEHVDYEWFTQDQVVEIFESRYPQEFIEAVKKLKQPSSHSVNYN